MRGGARSRPRRRYRDGNLRRVQHHRRHSGHREAHPRRWRNGGAGRGSVESVSARARHRPSVSRQGRDGRRRRLPCVWLHRHASRIAAGLEGSAGAGDHPLRRRRGRAARRFAARYPRRRREASVQLPERHAGHGGGGDSGPASPGRDQGRRPLHQLRRRPRLPVPVQLLHHHQRPGAQVALSDRRRRRGDRARQRRPGGDALFRHRRQFRPQPQLGADPRPPHRASRAGLQDQAPAPGRHALPQDPGLHREGGSSGLQRGLHRA